MSTEPGPSALPQEGVLEVAHFTPEQSALINRLIAARVEPSLSPTGSAGGTGNPPSSTSSTYAGEHFLGSTRRHAQVKGRPHGQFSAFTVSGGCR